jgi:hypothetical protein
MRRGQRHQRQLLSKTGQKVGQHLRLISNLGGNLVVHPLREFHQGHCSS